MTRRGAVTTSWRSVEELVGIGFGRSQLVLVNEAHDGFLRCARTRAVGHRAVDAAHDAGVRHFAMEALAEEFAVEANERRRIPYAATGYLAQADMCALIQRALDLGWTLLPYEADIAALQAHGDDRHDMRNVNRREAEQARNLAVLSGSGEPILVWCGNGHLIKVPVQDWRPMGLVLREEHGIDAFALDQTATVKWPGREPNVRADRFRKQLADRGGIAGFLSQDVPDGWLRAGADAYVLALDNEMT